MQSLKETVVITLEKYDLFKEHYDVKEIISMELGFKLCTDDFLFYVVGVCLWVCNISVHF